MILNSNIRMGNKIQKSPPENELESSPAEVMELPQNVELIVEYHRYVLELATFSKNWESEEKANPDLSAAIDGGVQDQNEPPAIELPQNNSEITADPDVSAAIDGGAQDQNVPQAKEPAVNELISSQIHEPDLTYELPIPVTPIVEYHRYVLEIATFSNNWESEEKANPDVSAAIYGGDQDENEPQAKEQAANELIPSQINI